MQGASLLLGLCLSKRFNPVAGPSQQENGQKGQHQHGSGDQPIDHQPIDHQSKDRRGPWALRGPQGPGDRDRSQREGLPSIRWWVRASVRLDRIQERFCPQGGSERPNGKLRQDQVSRGSGDTVGGQAEECPVWRSKQTQLDIQLPHSALDKLENFLNLGVLICEMENIPILQIQGGLACCSPWGCKKLDTTW